MALKIGNDYMVWVAAPGGTPTYALFGGQQDGSLSSSRQVADGSHKTSGSISLKVPGLRDLNINLSFVADLPDPNGYTLVETRHKAATTVLVQIRKGGSGASAADAVFTCEMYALQLDVTAALNGVLSGSCRFEPAVAPVLDLTLA